MNDIDEEDIYTRLDLLSEYYFEEAMEVKTPAEFAELGWYVLDKTLEILKEIHDSKHVVYH
jgi:hypothetical protein